MQRRSSNKSREIDRKVLAHIARWGGGHLPEWIEAEAWSRSLRRLSAAGLITYERGWRVIEKKGGRP